MYLRFLVIVGGLGATLFLAMGCREDGADGDADADADADMDADEDASSDADITPMEARIQYTACVGPTGTCGVTDCCASAFDRDYGNDQDVRCVVRPGTRPETYTLDFVVAASDQDEPAIFGEGLQFSSFAASPLPVRACDAFMLREEGNMFEAGTCETVDFDGGEGGGCVVELYLEESGAIIGRFRCKEIPIPGQDRYLSTIEDGAVAAGSLYIQGCDVRL